MFEYNYKKIILLLIFSILVIVFFQYLFFNSEILSSLKPSSNGKYRICGELFYNNDNLIKSISILIIVIFIFSFLSLLKMLKSKCIIFKRQNGFLYKDEKLVIEISKIKSLELKVSNRNHFIDIHINNVNHFIKNEQNLLKRLEYKLLNFSENTPLTISIGILKSNPTIILEKLQKLIS